MCQVLRELMKDEIQEEIKAERQDAADTAIIANIKNLTQINWKSYIQNHIRCDIL